jgi:hypothetical protein
MLFESQVCLIHTVSTVILQIVKVNVTSILGKVCRQNKTFVANFNTNDLPVSEE